MDDEWAPAHERVDIGPKELIALHDQQVNRLRLIDRLADDLAHEIKNPLNAIVINLELMKRRILDGQTDNALYRAECVTDEVRRVTELTDALFRVLRPNMDGDAPADVDGIIRALFPIFALQARLSGTELRQDLATGSARAQMSEAVFKQLILNLMAGALDSLEPGDSTVMIRTGRDGDGLSVRVVYRGARRPPGDTDRWHVVRSLAAESGAHFHVDYTPPVLLGAAPAQPADAAVADAAEADAPEAEAHLRLRFARTASGESIRRHGSHEDRSDHTRSSGRTLAETGTNR